jgi:hypothetical protein
MAFTAMVRTLPTFGAVMVSVALSRVIDGWSKSIFRSSVLFVPGRVVFSIDAGSSSKPRFLVNTKGPVLLCAAID